MGNADGVKGYRLWDPTAHKVIVSRDVIFVENKLQKEEDDNTEKERPETTQIHVEQRDCSEAEPAHEEPEAETSGVPQTRQSYRAREMVMIKWRGIVLDWWSKDMLRRKVLISMKSFLLWFD